MDAVEPHETAASAQRAMRAGALPRRASLLTALLLAVLAAGCQTPVRLMPTPVSFSTGEVDPFAKAGSTAKGTDVPVLYATNRAALIEAPEPIFTILPSEQVRVGVAHVRIGDDGLDWETLHRLSTSADPDQRPIVRLDWLEPMGSLPGDGGAASRADAQAFFALVDKALAASASRELVVYLHGANNTVPRAAAQAAQLRHFTGRRMVVLSFMWPSAGSMLRYLTDVASAAASVEPFAQLVEALAAKTTASSIDIVAYSAGAQVASPGLAKLGTSRPNEPRAALRERLRLRNVYYAAPDIDTRRSISELRDYVDIVERVSIAANLNDSALRVAGIVHGASRAGRPDPTELDAEETAFLIEASQRLGFDVIKVNPDDIPGLHPRSHAFWYEDPWVSSDLLGLLLLNAGPEHRGLEGQTGARGARYWTFPPDFYQRVVRLFAQPPSAAPASARRD
jgi:esterase/lipase superfamily enzyme